MQEDLTPETTKKVLDAFANGKIPKPGPQSGRQTSENSAGLTALTSKVCSTHTTNDSSSDYITALRSWRALYTRVSVAYRLLRPVPCSLFADVNAILMLIHGAKTYRDYRSKSESESCVLLERNFDFSLFFDLPTSFAFTGSSSSSESSCEEVGRGTRVGSMMPS